MDSNQKIKVGISIGDPNGIGIEIILKAFEDKRMFDFFIPIVFGNRNLITFQKNHFKLNTHLNLIRDIKDSKINQLNIINVWEEKFNVTFGKSNKNAGEISFKSLEEGTNALKNDRIETLVTAPINKDNIQSEKFKFKGHTDYLSQQLMGESLMFMIADNLKVGLITDHVPIKEITSLISQELVEKKISLIEKSLKLDFKIVKPKIAILAINPHAGDNGVIGDEDDKILIPIIHKLKKNRIMVFGPYPADSFFGAKTYLKFDAVLATYHDQGLIPFKTLSFGNGVNYTAGLNKVRTSPDHGTGYEIAGKGIAKKQSFVEALFLSRSIFIERSR